MAKKSTSRKTPTKKKAATKKTATKKSNVKKCSPKRTISLLDMKCSKGGWEWLEYHDDSENSHKFWAILVEGKHFTTQWGRVGTVGQKKMKSFSSCEEASKEALKLVREKKRKGYS